MAKNRAFEIFKFKKRLLGQKIILLGRMKVFKYPHAYIVDLRSFFVLIL